MEKVFFQHIWTLLDLLASSNKIWTGSSQLLPTCQKEIFKRKKRNFFPWKYVFLIIFGSWAEHFRLVVRNFPIGCSKLRCTGPFQLFEVELFFWRKISLSFSGFKQKLSNIERRISGALWTISRRCSPICLLRVPRKILTVFLNKLNFFITLGHWAKKFGFWSQIFQ